MNVSRMRVAAIWSISAWPALNFVMLNLEDIVGRGVSSCLGIALLTLAFGAVGHGLHWLANRRSRGGMAVVGWLALVVVLFAYSLLGEALEAIQSRLGWRVPLLPTWICLCAICAVLVYVTRRQERLHVAAATFCVVVASVTTIMLGQRLLSYERLPYDAASDLESVVAKPARIPGLNVYYVILDSYAGRRSLAAQTGFDNAEFYQRMAQRGFADVAAERSNYVQTAHTLAGIFALDYPFTDDRRSWNNLRALYPDVFARETPPPLVRRMSADGYETWYAPSFWYGCGQRHLKCIHQPAIFEANYLTRSFLAPTPYGQPLLMLAVRQYDALSTVRSRLPLVLAAGKPVFVFAHHLAPHPPFVIDAQCRPRTVAFAQREGWLEGERTAYADAVKCVNREVEQLVDTILLANPNALIVLQGDHGSAFGIDWETPMAQWTAEAIVERSSFLNLVRAPEDCKRWLDRPLGQINTARFVLACLEGTPPSYLPERTFLSTYSQGKEKGQWQRAPD
jgi:hypothetical protein